jgi:methyl-accepting chemotaxis protein
MMVMAALGQADPEAIQALQRIATSQVIMAVVMALFGVLALAVAVVGIIELRAARRFMAQTVNELRPQLAPLLDRAKHLTDDVAGMTDNVRRKVDDVVHTMEDVRRSVERARSAAEARAERFSQVLDVLQDEAEEVMLDAAAAARGVHEGARVLQETGSRRNRPGPVRGTGAEADREEERHEGP